MAIPFSRGYLSVLNWFWLVFRQDESQTMFPYFDYGILVFNEWIVLATKIKAWGS